MNCPDPACGARMVKDGSYIWKCPACRTWVTMHECIACGEKYSIVHPPGVTVENDHHCDPKREAQIENSRLANDEPMPRTPSLHARLAAAELMLSDDEVDD